jgi:hypothetical protein
MAFSGGLSRAVLPFYDSVFSRVFFLLLLFPQGNCFHFYFDGKTGFKGPLTLMQDPQL